MTRVIPSVLVAMALLIVGKARASKGDQPLRCFLIFDPMTKVQRDTSYGVTMIVYSESTSDDVQATLNGEKVEIKPTGTQIRPALAWFKGAGIGDSMDLIGKVSNGKNHAECKTTVKLYDQACEDAMVQKPYAYSDMVVVYNFRARCALPFSH